MTTKANQVFKSEFPLLAEKLSLKPFQESVINSVIDKGSTVAVAPTGEGKSLIYWIASRAIGGTCLVISPLIALIDEQALKLRDQNFEVLAIHAGMGATDQMASLKSFAKGEIHPDFIFASPERMATDGFFEYCIASQKEQVGFVVIDEVHCVSQWGFDFRPFYKHIPRFLNRVFNTQWPTILGLTATINPKELQDICEDFNIPTTSILKDDVLLRFDINIAAEKFPDEDSKTERLWELLSDHRDDKILVYQYRKYRKRGVQDLCEKALEKGFNALSFHGDMSGDERQEILREFRERDSLVIFATNAFGMGIDIPDIRVVIHFMIPESIEQYYQEIGRAGRDKKGAEAYILYSNKNIDIRKTHFIDRSYPDCKAINELYTRVTDNTIGYRSLQYFSEEDLVQTALPYFLNCGAISIEGKGFTSLKAFKEINCPQLRSAIASSRTGMVIPVLKKPPFNSLHCSDFFSIFYSALVKDKAKLIKSLDKCLIINAYRAELDETELNAIQEEIEAKRQYKHELLEYLVYLLDNFDETKSVHQEIGRYLGVDKHLLNKIHLTESGDWVRSKSEVIIANILYRSNIPFSYEEKLYYGKGKWKEPDFTIHYKNITWFWEHLGLLGDEKYNQSWKEKKAIFNSLGILDRVIVTKESAVLSKIANEKVELIKRRL